VSCKYIKQCIDDKHILEGYYDFKPVGMVQYLLEKKVKEKNMAVMKDLAYERMERNLDKIAYQTMSEEEEMKTMGEIFAEADRQVELERSRTYMAGFNEGLEQGRSSMYKHMMQCVFIYTCYIMAGITAIFYFGANQ
jgi:hypothetical protein